MVARQTETVNLIEDTVVARKVIAVIGNTKASYPVRNEPSKHSLQSINLNALVRFVDTLRRHTKGSALGLLIFIIIEKTRSSMLEI